MEKILQQITDWLKEMLVSGIMGNLSGMFDSVNNQVGEIASSVGTTPAAFSPGGFHDTKCFRVGNHSHSRHDTDLYRLLRIDSAYCGA